MGAIPVGLLQALSSAPLPSLSTLTGYSVLLPTADFATAAVTSIPVYDASLFVNGIAQALSGDPGGLINAVGQPIAADVALFSIAGGFEAIVLTEATQSIIDDFTSL